MRQIATVNKPTNVPPVSMAQPSLEETVFGQCEYKFAIDVEAASEGGRNLVNRGSPRRVDCSGHSFIWSSELKVSQDHHDESGDRVEEAPTRAYQCSVTSTLDGPSMPGVEARVVTALLNEDKKEVYTYKKVQLPTQAFSVDGGIEVFKMSLTELKKYVQRVRQRVVLILKINIRKLPPPTDYSGSFLRCFSKLHQTGDFSDVKLICSGHTFRCHKVILAARSEVFANMFKGDFREAKENRVFIDDVTPKTMEAMLEFIYCGNLDKGDSSVELMATAHRYGLQDLVKECCAELAFSLNLDNIFEALQVAHLCDRDYLFKYAVAYFKLHKRHCMEQEGWKDLSNNSDLLNSILVEI